MNETVKTLSNGLQLRIKYSTTMLHAQHQQQLRAVVEEIWIDNVELGSFPRSDRRSFNVFEFLDPDIILDLEEELSQELRKQG